MRSSGFNKILQVDPRRKRVSPYRVFLWFFSAGLLLMFLVVAFKVDVASADNMGCRGESPELLALRRREVQAMESIAKELQKIRQLMRREGSGI